MANTRHETTLAYKLDARGLKEARKEFERTFADDDAKKLNAQMASMKKQLAGLTQEQVKLNEQMSRVRAGTDAYKVLERALADVEKRARGVRSALGNIGSLSAPTAAAGAPAGYAQETGGPRTAFAAGAGGAIGGYFGARSAQRAGMSIANRAGGLLAGQGPLTTLTAGIPGIGGLAALAEGSVGQFLAFRRAQISAFPFLEGSTEGLAGLTGRAQSEARRRVAIPGALTAQDRLDARSGGIAELERSRPGMGISKVGIAREEAQRRIALAAYRRGELSAEQVYGVAAGEESLGGASKIPIAQRASLAREAGDLRNRERSLAQTARKRAADRAEAEAEASREAEINDAKARRRSLTKAIIRKKIRDQTAEITTLGARVGMDPTQALQAFQQLGQTIGIADADQFQQALAGQRRGVSMTTTAQLFRAQRAGRGGMEGQNIDVLANAIGGAVAMGLEGSEINENLASIVQLQGAAEQRGMKISAEGLQTMALSLSGGGLAGIQAQRIAGGFARQAQGLALSGAQDAESIALLRAGGFKSGAGFGNYFDALRNAENVTKDPEMMLRFIQNITAGIDTTTDEGRKKAAFTLSRTRFGRESVGSLANAEQLVTASLGGRGAFMANLARTGAVGPDGQINLRRLEGGARTLAATTGLTKGGGGQAGEIARLLTGPLKAQADISKQMIGIGGKVSGTVQMIQSNAADIASSVASLHTVIREMMPVIRTIGSFLGGGIENFSAAATAATKAAVKAELP